MPQPDYRDVYYSNIAGDEAHVQDLHSLGIVMHPPRGTVCYWPDENGQLWKEIGRVVVWRINGAINLHPYVGVGESELSVLRGAGWDTWGERPTGRHPENWFRGVSRHHGTYYECAVHIEATHFDPYARAIRTARGFQGWQDRSFRTYFNGADATV